MLIKFVIFAVLQLHREFCRAGADIAQAFTFYASEDKLENRGNEAGKLGVSLVNYLDLGRVHAMKCSLTHICLHFIW